MWSLARNNDLRESLGLHRPKKKNGYQASSLDPGHLKLRDRLYWQNHYNDVPNHVGKCVRCPEGRNIEATPGLSTVQDLAKRLTLQACSHDTTYSVARYKTKDYADQVFESFVGEYAKIQH